jgi:hypothetical protein
MFTSAMTSGVFRTKEPGLGDSLDTKAPAKPTTAEDDIQKALDLPHHDGFHRFEFHGTQYDFGLNNDVRAFESELAKMGATVAGSWVKALDGSMYNLKDPADVAALERDAADGTVNGKGNTASAGGTPTGGSDKLPAPPKMPPKGSTNTASGSGGSSESSGSSELTDEEKKAKAKADHAEAMNWTNRSPSELMDDIRNGRVPQNVASDPAAMLALQTKMQDYQRMWQMITDMVKLQHEMQMSIIRNFPKG